MASPVGSASIDEMVLTSQAFHLAQGFKKYANGKEFSNPV